jgi:lactaldehyde dehydrogenase/glycolaldehyde dehydrogenase
VSLELGGQAPFIVMDDVVVDSTARHTLTARFQNNGQACTCNERTYVLSPSLRPVPRTLHHPGPPAHPGRPVRRCDRPRPQGHPDELEKVGGWWKQCDSTVPRS